MGRTGIPGETPCEKDVRGCKIGRRHPHDDVEVALGEASGDRRSPDMTNVSGSWQQAPQLLGSPLEERIGCRTRACCVRMK
jgi:hypothetical protein